MEDNNKKRNPIGEEVTKEVTDVLKKVRVSEGNLWTISLTEYKSRVNRSFSIYGVNGHISDKIYVYIPKEFKLFRIVASQFLINSSGSIVFFGTAIIAKIKK